LAKVIGSNQFSLAVGYRTTAKVDDCFVLDQHAWLDFNSASSLKQQY